MTGYQVDRCTGVGCSTGFTQVYTPTSPTQDDTGRSPTTTYGYRVRAVDGSGNVSGNSTIAYATTPVIDATNPVVTITAPTAAVSYNAGAAGSITVGGTCSDNIGCTSVSLVNAAGGGPITATGVVNWSATVPLFNGSNAITATGADASGNTATDLITITSTVAGATISAAPSSVAPVLRSRHVCRHRNTSRRRLDSTLSRWCSGYL